MTMFAFFALNAIFELMYHFRVPAMPPQLEYAAAVIAYMVEGLLFLWHLDGRPPMDVQVILFSGLIVYLDTIIIHVNKLLKIAPFPLEKLAAKMKNNTNKFSRKKISLTKLTKIMNKLKKKKSAGLDGLGQNQLILGSKTLAKPLNSIIN